MRQLIWGMGPPLALAASVSSAGVLPADFYELTGIYAAKLICSKTVTSRQLVEGWLARIETHKALNSFISVDARAALAQADAYDQSMQQHKPCLPLGGVPIAIKDNIHVKGFANSAGTPALANFYPNASAPIVDRLIAAGAIVIGKSNMQELAYGTSGYNTAFHEPGVVGVRNAYDPTRIAGGSSSGSASAVGARLVPIALGTDTGGSIRQPCALNGCVGFRPTVGRYSQQGITPISHTRDTAGPMARSVEDVVLLDQVITGLKPLVAPKAAAIRLGVPAEFWQDLEPEVAVVADLALKKLEAAGFQLVPISMYGVFELDAKVGMPIALYEGKTDLQRYLAISGSGVSIETLASQISSPDVREIFDRFITPQKIPDPNGNLVDLAPAYDWAINTGMPALKQMYLRVIQDNRLDALVFPTSPEVAIKSEPQATTFAAFARMIRNADPGSNARMPGLTLPIGLGPRSALPVGLEIDGLPDSDGHLLAIGLAMQSVFGRQAGPAQ
jgi:Asp-tRNA(Asn)/Glu-tRNA(Gln) amidotransferase A subunit family amidase